MPNGGNSRDRRWFRRLVQRDELGEVFVSLHLDFDSYREQLARAAQQSESFRRMMDDFRRRIMSAYRIPQLEEVRMVSEDEARELPPGRYDVEQQISGARVRIIDDHGNASSWIPIQSYNLTYVDGEEVSSEGYTRRTRGEVTESLYGIGTSTEWANANRLITSGIRAEIPIGEIADQVEQACGITHEQAYALIDRHLRLRREARHRSMNYLVQAQAAAESRHERSGFPDELWALRYLPREAGLAGLVRELHERFGYDEERAQRTIDKVYDEMHPELEESFEEGDTSWLNERPAPIDYAPSIPMDVANLSQDYFAEGATAGDAMVLKGSEVEKPFMLEDLFKKIDDTLEETK